MDQKFLILIIMNFAVWGAMDQTFLIPIFWVPDTDQKFLIHINLVSVEPWIRNFWSLYLLLGSDISDPYYYLLFGEPWTRHF